MLIADFKQLVEEAGFELKRNEGIYDVRMDGATFYGFSKNEIHDFGPASAGYAIKRAQGHAPTILVNEDTPIAILDTAVYYGLLFGHRGCVRDAPDGLHKRLAVEVTLSEPDILKKHCVACGKPLVLPHAIIKAKDALSPRGLWKALREENAALVLVVDNQRHELKIENGDYVVYRGNERYAFDKFEDAITGFATLAGHIETAPPQEED